RRRLRRIDRPDPGMRMRRTQNLADELSGHRHIGGVHRAPGHLRHPIRAYRPRANPFEPRHDIVHGDLLGPSTIIWLVPRVARPRRKNKPLSGTGRPAANLAAAIRVRDEATLREQPSPRPEKCAIMM